MQLSILIANQVKRHFEMALQKDYNRIRKKALFYRLTFVFLGILFALFKRYPLLS